jgi:hypothetical protein
MPAVNLLSREYSSQSLLRDPLRHLPLTTNAAPDTKVARLEPGFISLAESCICLVVLTEEDSNISYLLCSPKTIHRSESTHIVNDEASSLVGDEWGIYKSVDVSPARGSVRSSRSSLPRAHGVHSYSLTSILSRIGLGQANNG